MLAEQLADQMPLRALPGRAVGEAAGPRLRDGDEIREVLRTERRMDASTMGGPPNSAMCVKLAIGSYGAGESAGAMACEPTPETTSV